MVKCLRLNANRNTPRRPQIKNDINSDSLPPLIANVLHEPQTHIDNLFADTWKQLRFGSLI